MAVGNTLIKAQPQTDAVEYKAGTEMVTLSMDTIKRYLVSGNGNLTDQEAMMFLRLCQHQHLNPFLREAYCIKYGDRYPATMVVGKDVFFKRARHRADFDGIKSGVILQTKDGEILEREGAFRAPNENLLGGWAKVYVKGLSVPYYSAVEWSEYVGMKDGKPNSMWASKPCTMIKKVAESQAMRAAFPDDFNGLYAPEEINTVDMEKLPDEPVRIPEEQEQVEMVEEEVIEQDDDVAEALFG